MTLIQNFALLLIGAHLMGWLTARAGQTQLAGQLLAGVILGPALLDWVSVDSSLKALSDLAVLVVVVAAGLEVRASELWRTFQGRKLLGLLPGFLLPAVMAYLLAIAFQREAVSAWVIALCLSVTALPVALRILSGFGLQGSRIAHVTIGCALAGDLVVFLALGAAIAATGTSAHNGWTLVTLSIAKLLGLIALVGLCALLCKRLYRRPHRTQLPFAALSILALAAASDMLGVHFAIGAFLGALVIGEFHRPAEQMRRPLHPPIENITQIVFAPLFLACQGTHFAPSSLMQPWFTVSLVAVAIGAKLIGGYWSARCCGLSPHDAKGVAIVMNARGLMEMVVAGMAFDAGLVDRDLFSSLMLVGIITTVCTPILLKRWQTSATATLPAASHD